MLESDLGNSIVETINAEISIGMVNSYQQILEYIKTTFYYIRMNKK